MRHCIHDNGLGAGCLQSVGYFDLKTFQVITRTFKGHNTHIAGLDDWFGMAWVGEFGRVHNPKVGLEMRQKKDLSFFKTF